MKKIPASDDSCGACLAMVILIGFAGFVIREILYLINDALLFVQRPDALARVVEFLETIGLCLGAAILMVILGIIIPNHWWNFLFGGSDDGGDDYYN